MSRKAQKNARALTPAAVKNAPARPTAYRIWDLKVPLLHLRVQPSGVKAWNAQWTWPKTEPRPPGVPRTSTAQLGKWPGMTIEAARAAALAVQSAVNKGRVPRAVVAEAVTLRDFVRDKFAPYARAHYKNPDAALDGLEATWAEALFDKPLARLAALDIERVRAARKAAGIKDSTINRDLDRLRAVLTKAVEWGAVAHHPMRTVKRRKVDNARVRYLSADEEKRLRKALADRETARRAKRADTRAKYSGPKRPYSSKVRPLAEERRAAPAAYPSRGFTDHLMPLVLVLKNTGLRRGEAFGIEWANVNLAGKMLTVPAALAKSAKTRHVPLNTEAFDVLTRWKGQRGGNRAAGLVFPNSEGRQFNNFNKAWAGLVAAAQLADFHPHDLRHDFASKLVMAGVDLNTVRELLGHADIKMVLRYAHLAPEKLADAVAKIGAVQ